MACKYLHAKSKGSDNRFHAGQGLKATTGRKLNFILIHWQNGLKKHANINPFRDEDFVC